MPHSPEVAEALERSIQHWRENREASVERISVSSSDCPLCQLFNRPEMSYSDRCQGCPITHGAPHRKFCENTPYDDVEIEYLGLCHSQVSEERVAAWQSLCDREIAFLESLRDDVPEKSGTS